MSGPARPFEIMRKQTLTRRIALFETVAGVTGPLDVTGYTGKYAVRHSLTDTADKTLLKIDMQIEGDPKLGIVYFVYADVAGPDGTDQEPFEGFEEITLFPPGNRVPISLQSWAGKLYGKFELLPTGVE